MFARASFYPPRLPRLLFSAITVASAMSRGAGMASAPTPPPGSGNGAGPAKAAAGMPFSGAADGATPVRTGILIHGCHLGAKRWRNIMWGDERLQRLGRLPHGVKLAWEEGACVVVLGTGASERDGVLEGRFALDYLTSNWERLREFREAFAGVDTGDMWNVVQPTLVAEVRSQNTQQELEEAGRLFRKENCDRVILVSSPTHLPRCLRDACSLWLDGNEGVSGDAPDAAGAQRASDLPPTGIDEGGHHRQHPVTAESPFATVGSANGLRAAGATTTEGPIHGGSEADADGGEDGGGDDGGVPEKGRRRGASRRRPWRPVILASPSGTNYADYGAADVAVVEPPHRGDSAHVSSGGGASNGGTCSNGSRPGADPSATVADQARRKLVARRFENGETAAGEAAGKESGLHSNGALRRADKGGGTPSVPPPPLLHELVALALRIGKGREEEFRREFQALLRRYVDVE
ncbi:unnamed protein product [Scytosiphon promiscuus]